MASGRLVIAFLLFRVWCRPLTIAGKPAVETAGFPSRAESPPSQSRICVEPTVARFARPVSSFASLPTERGGGLVDLLVARRPVRGANLDRRTDVVDLEVFRIRSELTYTDLVLGVSGVGNPLDTHALVGVVARTRNVEGLVHVPTLG